MSQTLTCVFYLNNFLQVTAWTTSSCRAHRVNLRRSTINLYSALAKKKFFMTFYTFC